MKLNSYVIFWVVVWVFLTLFFSASLKSIVVSFFFVTFLLPVIVGTSMVFNRYLVPKFLLKGNKLKFGIYLLYLLIVSVYLELLVMVLAFVILVDYQIENLGKIASDIYLLTVILYLIVLVEGLILFIQMLREKERRIAQMEEESEKEKEVEIAIRVDRKNVILRLEDILLIESLGDYVHVQVSEAVYITKEKISTLHKRLPKSFIRVHRSFIVNRVKVSSFNKELVYVSNQEIPIGRTYRKETEEALLASASS